MSNQNNNGGNNSNQTNPNTGSGTNGEGEDTIASFTNLGGDGLDTETLNLFGSFTNDAGAGNGIDGLGGLGGLGNAGFGQLSANDLSGFGVDLNSFDLGAGAGDNMSMDLSSIQLMNLDDASLGGGNAQPVGSTDDAAQMMARLLGPGSQIVTSATAVTSSITAPLAHTAMEDNKEISAPPAQSAGGAVSSTPMTADASTGGAEATQELQQLQGSTEQADLSVEPTGTGAGTRSTKTRSSSQSSDDMGDIPLAQLTLMQSGSLNQVNAGIAVPGAIPGALIQPPQMTTSALPLQGMDMGSQLGAATPLHTQGQLGQQTLGGIGAPPLGVTMLGTEGVEDALRSAAMHNQSSINALAQSQQQQHQRDQLQQPGSFRQLGQLSGLSSQLHGAGIVGVANALSTQAALDNALGPMHGALKMANTPVLESSGSGVESTVYLGKQKEPKEPDNSKLKLELPRPDTDIDETPLDKLEEIETQLCMLLDAASRAIRMMTGPNGAEQLGFGMEAGNSKIKATVKEFMQLVAQIQAGLRYQHKRLVSKGIPIEATAGFQSDVAGFERDLVAWSDAARLMASALQSGLEFSS
ncbi:hypothetical protein GGI25_005076 [Coemansia spiralis]|uniref:Mediator of RNA polymerase II transcription subunit 11 n=1 Tax=Coemansia spiralis TaxID=417178 RepID=A0A9W8KWT5_9FUNG|nr:hypothetical protein BX070DRAFT_16137 [Coemansia spiralis]KAJ2672521.1 hypothetical protein GGI25_005076 [Coemansia spiralis]